MAECEVPTDSLCIRLNEEVNGEEYENFVVDCIEEYPPLLVGQSVLVSSTKSVVEHSRTWVDALKKPCLHVKAKAKAKVNEEKKLDSPHGSVASSDASTTITDELGVENANGRSTKEEKTDLRDRVLIKRRIHEHAVDEVTSARDLVKLKRKEIESHLSVIRKLKTALPFDDLDSQEVLEQQLEAEKHLKTLKKELDILKANVLKAETAGNHDKEKKVKEVQAARDARLIARAQAQAQHQEKVDVKSSAISILHRFGALDDCSLSPDEKPHDVVPRHVSAVNSAGEDELKGQKLELLEANEGGELKAQMEMEKREKKREKRLTKKQKKKTVSTNNKIWVVILVIMLCIVFGMYLIYYS